MWMSGAPESKPTPPRFSASDKFMAIVKSLLNTPADHTPNTRLSIDGLEVPGHVGELLIDLLNRRTAVKTQKAVPQVCYVPQMGPIQSCDTCMVKVNGELVRACATRVVAGINVETAGEAVDIAQREAFDRLLQESHALLHCLRQQQPELHHPQHNSATGC